MRPSTVLQTGMALLLVCMGCDNANESVSGRSGADSIPNVINVRPDTAEISARAPLVDVDTPSDSITVTGGDEWDAAGANIRRLPVDSFPNLPAPVATAMRAMECAVPQGSDFEQPHNVIVGRFAAWDQVDWAFLCSQDGTSAIHVVWGGAAQCATPLRAAEDRAYLQGIGNGVIGFSRRIAAVDNLRMSYYQQVFDGAPVPPVWHEGIDDYFEGKASSIALCIDGEWITLQGVD